MSGTQQSLRRALGALKDTTTVGLAKVNSEYKDLDIAIVKATNHVECPPKDKHVRMIFAAASAARPRADTIYCLQALARRLSKTHNWTVALKSLIVIHRVLREGDPAFKEEISSYSRGRAQFLNLSNFKDDSSPIAWDYSAWVRTYALFLEERVDCMHTLRYDVEAERVQGPSRTRELSSDELLEQLPAIQQLLHRLIGCQPEGAAGSNYVIQYALALVLKESFKLYCAINDGMINLIDKFFEMQRHEAMKALDIYRRAAQQADKLADFYAVCKNLELARNFQFPSLAQTPQSFLATMEDYVKDAPRLMIVPKDIGDYNDEAPLTRLRITYEKVDEPEPDGEGSPASVHPDAPVAESISSTTLPVKEDLDDPDFLGIREGHPDAAALEESNALALAIVPSGYAQNGHTAPDPISSETTGWELALVTNPSSNNAALQNSKLGGGFDQLILDSLYDDAQMRQAAYPGSTGTYGVASNPFGPSLNAQDPFTASNAIPPPPSVQLAAMAHQQHMIMLQQQNLQHQQHMGSQPMSNPFISPYAANGSHQQYQNNPFGNPGLL